MTVTTKTLPANMIQATGATMVRTKLHKDVIDTYREEIETGAKFPPIVVFCEENSERYILADGFHRLYAHIHAEKDEIEVTIHEGGRHDALIHALGANAGHGLRRTNSDKINAVKMALRDPEISLMTQREIADICRVDHTTVGRVANRMHLAEIEKELRQVKTRQKTQANSPNNIRPTKPPPTQDEIDRHELRQALKLIRAFPYDGDDIGKLNLSKDDIAEVNYCIDWLTKVIEKYVALQHDKVGDQSEPQ